MSKPVDENRLLSFWNDLKNFFFVKDEAEAQIRELVEDAVAESIDLSSYAKITDIPTDYAKENHSHSEYAQKEHTHEEYVTRDELEDLPSGGGHPDYETVYEEPSEADYIQLFFGEPFDVVDEIQTDNGHTTLIRATRYKLPTAVATSHSDGLMSQNDKAKLDSINGLVADVRLNGASIINGGVAYIPLATPSQDGAMSFADKTKLDAFKVASEYALASDVVDYSLSLNGDELSLTGNDVVVKTVKLPSSSGIVGNLKATDDGDGNVVISIV